MTVGGAGYCGTMSSIDETPPPHPDYAERGHHWYSQLIAAVHAHEAAIDTPPESLQTYVAWLVAGEPNVRLFRRINDAGNFITNEDLSHALLISRTRLRSGNPAFGPNGFVVASTDPDLTDLILRGIRFK